MTMREAYFAFLFLLVCITDANSAGKFQSRGSVLGILLSKRTCML